MSLIFRLSNPRAGTIPFPATDWVGVQNTKMPSEWNQAGVICRVRTTGTFTMNATGDVFTRKLWIGSTPTTLCSVIGIRATERRIFDDVHEIAFYSNGTSLVTSSYYTGICSIASDADPNVLTTSSGPAAVEVSRIENPLVANNDWSFLQFSVHGHSTKDIPFVLSQFNVELL